MNLADRTRNFAAVNYVYPARKAKLKTVSFSSGEIHQGLVLVNRYPAVCDAIDTDLFREENRVELVDRTGPRQGSNVMWTFKV
jgi:hypothetical protein